MSAPTPVVRAVTYERDGHRCVSCGARIFLEWQHRLAVGMGGSKLRPRYEEGVTSCAICNPAYESTLQIMALLNGWKVKKVKAAIEHPEDVPVFYWAEQAWFQLTDRGTRVRISEAVARQLMDDIYGAEYAAWQALEGVGARAGADGWGSGFQRQSEVDGHGR